MKKTGMKKICVYASFVFSLVSLFPFVWDARSETDSLNEGLVAYYPLDGDAKDRTENGNHADRVKGELKFVDGVCGKALSLDGKTYAVGTVKKYPLGKSERTLCLWVKSNDPKGEFDGNQQPNFLFGWGDFRQGGDSFGIMEDGGPWLLTDDWFTYTREKKQMDGHDVTFGKPADGEWQFLCSMVREGSVVNYVAGKEVKSGTVEIDTAAQKFFLGTSPIEGRFNFSGLVDEIRVYERALKNEEIERLYKMGQKKMGEGKNSN